MDQVRKHLVLWDCPSLQEEQEPLRRPGARPCSLLPCLEPGYDPRKTQRLVAQGNERKRELGTEGKGSRGRGKAGEGRGAEMVTWVR